MRSAPAWSAFCAISPGGYELPFYLCIALEVAAAALIMVRGSGHAKTA